MQIKLRKILAVLSCLAMLCTVLPVGILSVSAEDSSDFVTNGDFETGDLTGWKNSYSGEVQSDVVHSGSYAHKTTNTASKYQGMMQQNPISVVPNSDYTVTFWYYYEGSNATGSGASFYLYPQTTDNATNLGSKTIYPTAANTWVQVTHTFNTGDNAAIALVWSNRMANDGGTYYFDDVVMTGPAVGSVITPDEEADGNLVA
ncbi:MAG: carbohydrate binding domain-containing protein, partial [Clostridia bacterium]|nr:carbohydrate binding domain-containing protein [Clostridia bacterium]